MRERYLQKIPLYNDRLEKPFWGFKTDITHVRVLGMSVNLPTEAFCLQICSYMQWKLYLYLMGGDLLWPLRNMQV